MLDICMPTIHFISAPHKYLSMWTLCTRSPSVVYLTLAEMEPPKLAHCLASSPFYTVIFHANCQSLMVQKCPYSFSCEINPHHEYSPQHSSSLHPFSKSKLAIFLLIVTSLPPQQCKQCMCPYSAFLIHSFLLLYSPYSSTVLKNLS